MEEFNQSLENWGRVTGCKANFNWKYRGDSKKLYAVDIVYPVYSHREVTDTDIQSALAKFAEEKTE